MYSYVEYDSYSLILSVAISAVPKWSQMRRKHVYKMILLLILLRANRQKLNGRKMFEENS